ncbi:hypothetical protein [Marinithermus hydrothermalis]
MTGEATESVAERLRAAGETVIEVRHTEPRG